MSTDPSERAAKLVSQAIRLRIDGGAAEVLRGFEQAGVRALLLKGPSFGQWLYPGEDRVYVDCDLLVAPGDVETAEVILESLAYSRSFDESRMPEWWREHAGTWLRDADGLTIDLHQTLPGVHAEAESTWRTLSSQSAAVVVAGYAAPALGLPARALHVALHAAQHGDAWARPLADLERALELSDDALWNKAAMLAADLQAVDAFASGLRLSSAGAVVADRLGLPGRSVDAELRAATPPPLALGFEQLARAHGISARIQIVARKVVPPPAFMRHWDPSASAGRAALLRAYVRRPFWLLRHSPRGVMTWWRARRSARAGNRST